MLEDQQLVAVIEASMNHDPTKMNDFGFDIDIESNNDDSVVIVKEIKIEDNTPPAFKEEIVP